MSRWRAPAWRWPRRLIRSLLVAAWWRCTAPIATPPGPTGDSPLAQAPHFRDLYLRYDVQDLSEALVEGIVTAHPEMPQFEFDPDQAAAIVAYLETLEPVPPAGSRIRRDHIAPSPPSVLR